MTARQIVKAMLPEPVLAWYRLRQSEAQLSKAAKQMRADNATGLPAYDCGPTQAVDLAAQWIARAQDRSTSSDGGIARHFSLNTRWSPSYPETTGYIVPTFIRLSALRDNSDYADRARQMLDWLVSIQLNEGAFQGGMIGVPPVPVTFNTGQILLGLAAGVARFGNGSYETAMHKAASWLRDTLDDDGCWRRFDSPYTVPGEKAYETHVSWGLLEAERISPGQGYGEAALRQIGWAATKVRPNGWIANCCLNDAAQPLTHTIGYALRGFIEGFRFSRNEELLELSIRIGEGLRNCVDSDGYLPGRIDSDWHQTVTWSCLTGTVQNSANFLDLYDFTGDSAWREAAARMNSYVRRTLIVNGDPDWVGAVAGSFPIEGDYGSYEYLNWAAKFMIDAQLMELESQ